MSSNQQTNNNDPRRPDRIQRYKLLSANCLISASEDPTPDYMNLLSMLFSMCGLMMKLKWSAWVALFCSAISFANSRSQDDFKQIFSCFMLSFSAVVMTYLQNPLPMILPFAN